MSIQSDFMIAVNQIAAERGLDIDDILDAIKQAIATTFRKDYGNEEEEGEIINVDIDSETGEVAVFMDKKVVEEVTNPATQISLEEAQKHEEKLRIGDHIEIDVTPGEDFGRVAAQATKQVILQKLREAEKNSQIEKYINRVGEIETGIVQRMDGENVIWEIGRTTAIMPSNERVATEYYRGGSKHKLLLKEIVDTPRGKSIIVSRADNNFLKGLFALEIPELLSDTVEIKSIAREAGQRSKVAVTSNVDGIDPIGACVGQRGVRIMAIMNELKMGQIEEKVDIILWDEDEEQFVVNALSPAEVLESEVIDKDRKIIKIIVPDEQLSLAIGKDGQNVRLAAKLTGWNIDIQGETVKVESKIYSAEEEEDSEEIGNDESDEILNSEKESDGEIESLELSTRTLKALQDAGIETVEELKEKLDSGEKIKGIGPKAVEEINKAIA